MFLKECHREAHIRITLGSLIIQMPAPIPFPQTKSLRVDPCLFNRLPDNSYTYQILGPVLGRCWRWSHESLGLSLQAGKDSTLVSPPWESQPGQTPDPRWYKPILTRRKVCNKRMRRRIQGKFWPSAFKMLTWCIFKCLRSLPFCPGWHWNSRTG